MIKTILLTGATGYLGTHLAEHFLNKGYHIIALALNRSEQFRFDEHENVSVYYLNETEVGDIFEKEKVDIVIHTATLYGRKQEQIADMVKANIEFPLTVLTAAAKHGTELFINTDTILVKNINPYALTKAHIADWLSMYADKIKCVDMKLDHFYGPNDKPVKFIAWLIEQFKNNVPSIDLTEGSQTRDFIYIDDVVSAFDCVLENREKIPFDRLAVFEVGTNVKTSIKDMVWTIKKTMGNTATQLNFGAVPYRKNEVLDYEINTLPLRMLGWKPAVTNVKDGINKICKEEGLIQ